MVSPIQVVVWRTALVFLCFIAPVLSPLLAQDETDAEESAAGSPKALIDYARDVAPIFAAKCLKCHGPDEAKNDFRVDDSESLLTYVEPSDLESSSLWVDYLITDDPDMRMPPSSDDPAEQLTGPELAIIKLWIEEGGKWSDALPVAAVEEESAATLSLAERIWKFQGLFHPATTHFPVALLTVSALFVLLSFIRPDTCEPVAFHCLWIGTLGAIVASAAGWSYAEHEGYGASASFDLANSAIDRHRWLGIGVALLAVIMVPVAMYVRRTEDFGMRFVWLLGSTLLLVGVGIVGYQGGELTYGEGHYEKEFVKYFPDAFATDADAPPTVPRLRESGGVTASDVGMSSDGETVSDDGVTDPPGSKAASAQPAAEAEIEEPKDAAPAEPATSSEATPADTAVESKAPASEAADSPAADSPESDTPAADNSPAEAASSEPGI